MNIKPLSLFIIHIYIYIDIYIYMYFYNSVYWFPLINTIQFIYHFIHRLSQSRKAFAKPFAKHSGKPLLAKPPSLSHAKMARRSRHVRELLPAPQRGVDGMNEMLYMKDMSDMKDIMNHMDDMDDNIYIYIYMYLYSLSLSLSFSLYIYIYIYIFIYIYIERERGRERKC